MGRPLRKLHQIHSNASVQPVLPDACPVSSNNRTTGFPQGPRTQTHESTGLCVKKLAAGKGETQQAAWGLYGLRYHNTSGAPIPHRFVTFSPALEAYMTPLDAVSARFAGFVAGL
jgi:hypothetical protein